MNLINMARHNQERFEILELNIQDPITFQKGKKTENNENTGKLMLIVPS
jgi:hypothetical protein